MSELNTELMSALLKNESLDEVFRSHLETAMNDLLKIVLWRSSSRSSSIRCIQLSHFRRNPKNRLVNYCLVFKLELQFAHRPIS